MRVVIQRVSKASVSVDERIVGEIGTGLLILAGIEDADNEEDIEWITNKVTSLRIFNDVDGVMNLSLRDVKGRILLVSQFTLHASTKKGNRPSYIKASKPEVAIPLYERLISSFERVLQEKIERGVFGAHMEVALVNDGPVTIIMDSRQKDF